MQPHDHSPLNDFIEYSEQSMLARSAEFLNAMQRRHSIRLFSDRPVDKAIIENYKGNPINPLPMIILTTEYEPFEFNITFRMATISCSKNFSSLFLSF